MRMAVFLFIAALIFAALLVFSRRLALTASLIEQSTKVLSAHPGLILASALLLIAKVVLLAVGVGVCVLLVSVGKYVHSNGITGTCEWHMAPGMGWGIFITVIFMLWAYELFFAIRFHVVSFTTGAWYAVCTRAPALPPLCPRSAPLAL